MNGDPRRQQKGSHMNTLKTLMVAAALAVVTVPAVGQVAGNLPFSVPLYNEAGQVGATAVPNGNMTQFYKLDGRYIGRTSASAYRIGQVVSLFEVHIGCTTPEKAEAARLAPNTSDRVNCGMALPSIPYFVEKQDSTPGAARGFSSVCLRPFDREDVPCRWFFLAYQLDRR